MFGWQVWIFRRSFTCVALSLQLCKWHEQWFHIHPEAGLKQFLHNSNQSAGGTTKFPFASCVTFSAICSSKSFNNNTRETVWSKSKLGSPRLSVLVGNLVLKSINSFKLVKNVYFSLSPDLFTANTPTVNQTCWELELLRSSRVSQVLLSEAVRSMDRSLTLSS